MSRRIICTKLSKYNELKKLAVLSTGRKRRLMQPHVGHWRYCCLVVLFFSIGICRYQVLVSAVYKVFSWVGCGSEFKFLQKGGLLLFFYQYIRK
jgi:hypothetical protein